MSSYKWNGWLTRSCKSNEACNYWTVKYLGNIVGGVGLPIWEFPRKFYGLGNMRRRVVMLQNHFFRASSHIVAIFRSLLGSIAWNEFDTVPRWWFRSSNASISASLRLLAFLFVNGREHQNHHFLSDGTNHGMLFYLEQCFQIFFFYLSSRCVLATVFFE